MPSQPGLFSRSIQLFGRLPGIYLSVAVLPYCTLYPALWWALFRFLPIHEEGHPDLRSIWRAMSLADQFEFLALFFLLMALPFAVAGFGLCRVASNQIENRSAAFREVARSMLGFLPSALLLSIVFGASTFLAMCFLFLPGVLVASAFSLVVPAASIEHLGPFAALRRGFSLMKRAFGRLLASFLLYSLVVACAFVVQGIVLSSMPHTVVVRIPVMSAVVLALLAPLAIYHISVVLIFGEARCPASPVQTP